LKIKEIYKLKVNIVNILGRNTLALSLCLGTGANPTTPGANPTTPGANPTIASYNASVVEIYSAVNSMARF
jgi:hypothetical protein